MLLGLGPAFGDGLDPGSGGGGTRTLAHWGFEGTNWLATDVGSAPRSSTNALRVFDPAGDNNALLLDSTNAAWVQYNLTESYATNITADGSGGAISLWLKPSWSSTNIGVAGPGDWASLVQIGSFASNGVFAIFFDPSGCVLSLAAQTNGGSQILCCSAK